MRAIFLGFTTGLLTISRAGFLNSADTLENMFIRRSTTGDVDCTKTVECQVLTTLQPCIDTNVTCTCTEANEQNLQSCFNCLVAEEPTLPQSNQTAITSDITELVADFNSQCSPRGIPTLTFPSEAAENTGITSGIAPSNSGSGGSGNFGTADPSNSSPTAQANPADGSITDTPGPVNTNLPDSSQPTPAAPAVAPSPSPNVAGQVTVRPSTTSGPGNTGSAPSPGGIQGQSGGASNRGSVTNGLVLGVVCAVVLGLS